LCTKSDVVTVTCPTTIVQPTGTTASAVSSCGYAQVPIKISSTAAFDATQTLETLTWRGCINSAAGSTSPKTDFSFYFLTAALTGDQITAAAYSYCTSVTDLCNKPISCYRCSDGWSKVCNSFDIVLDEAYDINMKYCGSLTVTTNTNTYSCSSGTCYWKGCLLTSDVTTLTTTNSLTTTQLNTLINAHRTTYNAGTVGVGLNDIQTILATITSSSLNYCNTDGCNAASQLYNQFNLSIMISALLFYLVF